MATTANRDVAEASSGMPAPDIVLPSQRFGPQRQQAPEQRLMMAVLQDALECVTKYRCATHTRSRRLFREAQRWFLIDESDWPYSFEGICGVLELDANAVRQRLGVALTLQPVRERHAAFVRR